MNVDNTLPADRQCPTSLGEELGFLHAGQVDLGLFVCGVFHKNILSNLPGQDSLSLNNAIMVVPHAVNSYTWLITV